MNVAIVRGADAGMGRATALRFAQAGPHLANAGIVIPENIRLTRRRGPASAADEQKDADWNKG
jgi:NAD(P)-dependent dehydrogenase (short-subunit alcohol dehydrogenase family)